MNLRGTLLSIRRIWAQLLGLPVVVLLWQSLFWMESVPLAVKAASLALAVWSAVRPHDALLLLAGLATLSVPIAWLVHVPPDRMAEVLVLAFLAGWTARVVVRRDPPPDRHDSLRGPAVVLIVIVAASLVVAMSAMQDVMARPWPFAVRVFTLLGHDYIGGSHYETHHWPEAARLVEGLLLMLAVMRLARGHQGLQRALSRVVAIGVIAASVLSCLRVLTVVLRSAEPGAMLVRILTTIRISVHVGDLNAAGSQFALALPVVCGLAIAAYRRHARPESLMWGAFTLPLLAALWLTGSRAAQFAVLAVAAAALVMAATRRLRWAMLALIAVAVPAIVWAVIASKPQPEASVQATLEFRWLFTKMSLKMLALAPWFGLGIGEFYDRSTGFMPEALKTLYTSENAHNNFLQVAVELGLAGLAAFLWLLGAMAVRIWRGVRREPRDPLLLGLAFGLAATLMTFLVGHPLLVGSFAFPFWIATALGVSMSDEVPRDERRPMWSPAMMRRAAVAAALLVAVLLPFRAAHARGSISLTNVRYGFGDAGYEEATRTPYVWAGPRATFFAASNARWVAIIAAQPAADAPVTLNIRIDGELANSVMLQDGLWREMRMLLPVTRASKPFRRIDLEVVRAGGGATDRALADASGESKIRVKWIDVK